jgi:hypothetical protein
MQLFGDFQCSTIFRTGYPESSPPGRGPASPSSGGVSSTAGPQEKKRENI